MKIQTRIELSLKENLNKLDNKNFTTVDGMRVVVFTQSDIAIIKGEEFRRVMNINNVAEAIQDLRSN